MHYLIGVIVSSPYAESEVEEALAPFKDEEWDYYIIGGRYSGSFTECGYGDIVPVACVLKKQEAAEEHLFCAIVVDGEWYRRPWASDFVPWRVGYLLSDDEAREYWERGHQEAERILPRWREKIIELLREHQDKFIAIVDCHN